MTNYRDQGEGELVPGRGFEIACILYERGELATHVTLRSGESFAVTGVSYGRDIGAEWEHLYFDADGNSYFLCTSHIAILTAPETSAVFYQSG